MTLPVSNLINVSVNLSPSGAQVRNFGILMIVGDSNVISGSQRFREYTSIGDVAGDFSTTAPEYLAAQLFFSQKPQPQECMIARWLRTATAGMNQGAILNATQQALANFTCITAGAFGISIDGTVQNLSALNFSALTNLNAVASAINSALTGGASCIFNGSQFIITSGSTGAGTQATGTVTLTSNPSANDTLTVNGTTLTFVASSPSGNEVLIGGTAAITATNLNTFLNASSDTNISQATYTVSTDVVTVTDKTVGTGGNSFTLAKSSTAISLSGATLSGGVVPSSVGYATSPGSGQDISSLLGLTSSTSIGLVPGYNSETPLQCITAMADLSTDWYSSMFAASVQPSDSDNLAIAPFIEAQNVTRMFGVTIQNTNVLSSQVTTDLASLLKAGGYNQTCCQYSSSSPYAIASFFGRSSSVNFNANNSTITMMYKQEPTITAETLTVAQAATLQAKNCNVFVNYNNSTAIIQYGPMCSGVWFDTIYGLDWLQNNIQTNCYNALYTSTTKVPQTDAGVAVLISAISSACEDGINNGLIAPGTWNSAGFGQLQQGQYLKDGYYIYATPISQQSQSDRDARIAPSIQVAVKLAGAIQTMPDVMINVNQ